MDTPERQQTLRSISIQRLSGNLRRLSHVNSRTLSTKLPRIPGERAISWDLEYSSLERGSHMGSRHKKNVRGFAREPENNSMLKKPEYRETGSVTVPSKLENDPTFVSSNGSDSEKSPVTIAVKNKDIPRVQPKNISIFGSTLVFRGELSADEEILIQGTIEGTIAHHKKNLTIGKEGRVTALIHASSITIEGWVDGDIHADVYVRLTDGAEVNGNIFSPCIKMDEGARFNGTMHMGPSVKLSVAARPTAV